MNNKEYLSVRIPDKAMLAEYLERARGENRTMSDFAEECGTSAATLSRILTGKIKHSIPEELIKTIWEKSADETLDLKSLMYANGMISTELYERRMRQGRKAVSQGELINIKQNMKNIINSELFTRNVDVRKLGVTNADRRTPIKESDNLFPSVMLTDLAVELSSPSGPIQWGFDMVVTRRDKEDTERDDLITVRRMFERRAIVFLEDAWGLSEKNTKISFVFSVPEHYNIFNRLIEKSFINSRMSSILLDLQRGVVVEEYFLSNMHTAYERSIFKEPIKQNQTEIDVIDTYEFVDELLFEGDE